MSNDDIWILGINMTKFGKYPLLDPVDLASEAALAALADGGVTMKDMGVLAAGNLMGAAAGIGQQLQKQIGQTGIPVFNVANACATGATAIRTVVMAIKAGECDMGLAVGVEKLSGAGMLGGGGFGAAKTDEWTRTGRYGTVSGLEGKTGTDMMPGVFAQVGMEYGHKYGGTSFELFARISSEEPQALHAQPAGRHPEGHVGRAGHERADDRLPEHPGDVLGQHRRRRRRGARVGRASSARSRWSSRSGP